MRFFPLPTFFFVEPSFRFSFTFFPPLLAIGDIHKLDCIIQQLATTHLRANDMNTVVLDSAVANNSDNLQANCCYGQMLHGRQVNFKTIKAILERAWNQADFTIYQVPMIPFSFCFNLAMTWMVFSIAHHGISIIICFSWPRALPIIFRSRGISSCVFMGSCLGAPKLCGDRFGSSKYSLNTRDKRRIKYKRSF